MLTWDWLFEVDLQMDVANLRHACCMTVTRSHSSAWLTRISEVKVSGGRLRQARSMSATAAVQLPANRNARPSQARSLQAACRTGDLNLCWNRAARTMAVKKGGQDAAADDAGKADVLLCQCDACTQTALDPIAPVHLE